jgi:hypothetical protein
MPLGSNRAPLLGLSRPSSYPQADKEAQQMVRMCSVHDRPLCGHCSEGTKDDDEGVTPSSEKQ